MTARPAAVRIALVTVLAAALVAAPAALAGRGGGGKNGPTGSFSLVLLNSADGLPHHGQDVTFTVTSTALYPWVNLTCYEAGDWVVNQHVGFYAGYPWSQTFPLYSWKWTAGAADCTARLYDGTTGKTLATMSFHAYA